MRRWCTWGAIAVAVAVAACGGSGGGGDGDGDGDGDSDSSGIDGGGGGSADASDCEAPHMLILLDRTQSMARNPAGDFPANTPDGRMTSKWWIAVEAIEALTAELDQGVRFGLALFPQDPGGGDCVTVQQRISGTDATNPDCQAGEVLVSPAPSTSDEIAAAIDPETSLLCNTTPIGLGVDTAGIELANIIDPTRDQYVLFVGDGQDTCDDAIVTPNTQALAAAGVRTFVVSFDGSGGVDNGQLNDMACAGQTAIGFPATCVDDGNGNYSAADPGGDPLYFQAENGAQLAAALADAAGQVCCNCVD